MRAFGFDIRIMLTVIQLHYGRIWDCDGKQGVYAEYDGHRHVCPTGTNSNEEKAFGHTRMHKERHTLS